MKIANLLILKYDLFLMVNINKYVRANKKAASRWMRLDIGN